MVPIPEKISDSQLFVNESLKSKSFKNHPIEQTMEILPKGARRLAAQLRTSIGFEDLWKVLTSYDQLSEFIPNLASSKLISRKDNKVILSQVGSQEFFGFRFSAEVLIQLIEDRHNGVLKFNLLKGDFQRFEGSWNINKPSDKKGSLLLYELTVQGCIGMPVSLIEQRLRKDLTANLLAVEKAALEGNSL